MPAATVPCPKCGRQLASSGTLTVLDREFPIYQCDECLQVREALGIKLEGALTFAVNEAGQAFDPADPDTPLFPQG